MSDTAVTAAPERNPGIVNAWIGFSRLLVLVVYAQSIFAGFLLSGQPWGREAHRITAFSLVAGTFIAGIAALITLRRFPSGNRLGLWMVGLGVAITIQMAIGLRAADGERILWLHIPFGVALVGVTAQLEMVARRLGKANQVG